MTAEEAKEVLATMLAEWSSIPTADILWRVEGPVAGLTPGRDGKNIFWIDPGYVHGDGEPTRWGERTANGWGYFEVDHRIDPNSVRSSRQSYDDDPGSAAWRRVLIAHPDVEWLANPWFFYERQGELRDEMLLYPVRARAGQTTSGIEITMSRGR